MTHTQRLTGQICITGANGFIGKQLVEALSKEELTIRILTRKSKVTFPKNVEVIIGDLTKPDCPLNQFLNGCDILFHCAGEINDINLMGLLHIEGTKKLIESALEECRVSGKKIHWIQLSSCGAYGPPMGKPQIERTVTENSPTHPANEYESTKTKSDELVISACQNGQMSFSILRPSNVFGSTMTDKLLIKIIWMVKKRSFFYLGKAGAVATYVHVNDVINALIILAIDSRAKGEIYNLSNDCTFEELIGKISSLLVVTNPTLRFPAQFVRIPLSILSFLLKKWIHIPTLEALVMRTRYPTNKIESELNFVFSMPMPNAVEDLINDKSKIFNQLH